MSRHHLLQPEKFEPSQFRIRASKKVKQASNNYENVSPIYLPTLSQYSILYNNQNYGYEQESCSDENFEYDEQENYEYSEEENEQENYEYGEEANEQENYYESNFNNDPKIFDGKKHCFSNENISEFKSFTTMAFFIWITKYMICK